MDHVKLLLVARLGRHVLRDQADFRSAMHAILSERTPAVGDPVTP